MWITTHFFSIDDENFDKDEQIKELKEPTATTTITTTNDAWWWNILLLLFISIHISCGWAFQLQNGWYLEVKAAFILHIHGIDFCSILESNSCESKYPNVELPSFFLSKKTIVMKEDVQVIRIVSVTICNNINLQS